MIIEDKKQKENFHPDKYLRLSYPISHQAQWIGAEMFDYDINGQGYRSPEFKKDVDSSSILVAGCSVTFGEGLFYKDMWSEHLTRTIKKDVFNLSSSGRSIANIIDDIIFFIEEYGRPRIIMMLLPETQRYHFWTFNKVKKLIIDRNDHDYKKILNSYSTYELTDGNKSIIKNDDELDAVGRVFNYDTRHSDMITRLYQFEKYMEAIGVPLIYTSWDEPTEIFLWTSKKIKGFFPYTKKYKEPYVEEHYDAYTEEEKDLWLEAADKPNPHPGILFQKSFANAFYKEAIERFGEKIFN